MQYLTGERIQGIPSTLPARTALQMHRSPGSKVCQQFPTEETKALTPKTCPRRSTSLRLFVRRRRNAWPFMSQSASAIHKPHSFSRAHSSEAEFAPKRTTLRGSHFRQADMVATLSRSQQICGACDNRRENPSRHTEKPRKASLSFPFAAKYQASSDEPCSEEKVKGGNRQKEKQQTESFRTAKQPTAAEVPRPRGRGQPPLLGDLKTEEAITYAYSSIRQNIIAGGNDSRTPAEVPITHTPAVEETAQTEVQQVGLQLKVEEDTSDQTKARKNSSPTHHTVGKQKSQASEAILLGSRDLRITAAVKTIEAAQNPGEILPRKQPEHLSKCVDCGDCTMETKYADVRGKALTALEVSPPPETEPRKETDVHVYTSADTFSKCGRDVPLPEYDILGDRNHLTFPEDGISEAGFTCSVRPFLLPSLTHSTPATNHALTGVCALPEATVCSIRNRAGTPVLKAACPHVTFSTPNFTWRTLADACSAVSSDSAAVEGKKTDGREKREAESGLDVHARDKIDAAPLSPSICELPASRNSAPAHATERAEDSSCVRRKNKTRQMCTNAMRPPTGPVTATKLTTATAVSASGGSSFFGRLPAASLHLPCCISRSGVCTGSSRQASVRDTPKLQCTPEKNEYRTACSNSSECLSARELHVVSSLESSLCCCCECGSSSIVITSTAQLSTHQKLAPLYPVPPSPRKFYDRQGSGLSGKPGWYGHNYPSFRSTRIQQCGLLYLNWRRGQLRIRTIVRLLLQEVIQQFPHIIRRATSSICLLLQNSALSRAQKRQCINQYSTKELTMSDAFLQENPRVLDLLVDRDAEQQQRFPHVCALPYCKGTVIQQYSAVSPCNGSPHSSEKGITLPPAESSRVDPFMPEELNGEFCQVGQKGAAAGETRRSKSNTRLSFVCTSSQPPLSDVTGSMQKETRGDTMEKGTNSLLHSNGLLYLAAHETSHFEANDKQDKVAAGAGAFHRGPWLNIESVAESGFPMGSRNKRRRAYSRRAVHTLPQEAVAVADLLPKHFRLLNGSSQCPGGVRRRVEHGKDDGVCKDGDTATENLYREKVKMQREKDAPAVSGSRARSHIRNTIILSLLGLLVPAWLQSFVNLLLLHLSARLALLTGNGLLRGPARFLVQPLRRLLLDAPKELLLPLMPTVVAKVLNKITRERENLGVPDSETRRRLNFILLLMIMYPFVHGFYIPCLLLLWLLRQAYDAFWGLCAVGCCNYRTSKQQLRHWQEQSQKQQQHQPLRQQNLQRQELCQQQSQCTLHSPKAESAIPPHKQQNGLQKLVGPVQRILQEEQGKPPMQPLQQPDAQQDGRRDQAEQRGQRYPGRLLDHKEQQMRRGPVEQGKGRDTANRRLQQQCFRPWSWHPIWSQQELPPAFLIKSYYKQANHTKSPSACDTPIRNNQVTTPEKVMSWLYCSLSKGKALQRRASSWWVNLRFWNTSCFLILLPSRHTLALFRSLTARHLPLGLWAHTTAAAAGGRAHLLRLLRHPPIFAKPSKICKSRDDACSGNELTESRAALLLQKFLFTNSFNSPLRIFTSIKELTIAGKNSLCNVLSSTTARSTLMRPASTLWTAGFSAASGSRRGGRGTRKKRETEILGLLNGQEVVLFSQPHMVVCGVGYTEQLTRQELLHVIRKKLLAPRDEAVSQHAQQGSDEGDNDGLRNRQIASEKRARKQEKHWRKERIPVKGGEEDEGILKKPSNGGDEQRSDTSPAKMIGKEEDGNWKQRGRGGNENYRWNENATVNSSDEDCAIPLLCFKHPRLRTTVRKVLNRYCWVRDENFSAARHVISLNRQQVLTLLALHRGQQSPTDFSRFRQNLLFEQAARERVHSICCCQRCNRENVLKEEETREGRKPAFPSRTRRTGLKEWDGAARQREIERLSGKESPGKEEKEMMSDSGSQRHKAAEGKQHLRRKGKRKRTKAGRERVFSSDQVGCNRMVLHTYCSFSKCGTSGKLSVCRSVSSTGGGSSMRTSEQSVEEQSPSEERLVFKRCNSGDTNGERDPGSCTGRRYHSTNRMEREEENVEGVFVRPGYDRRIQTEVRPAFSPGQTLAAQVGNSRVPGSGVPEGKGNFSKQGSSLFLERRKEKRERKSFYAKDCGASQAGSNCLVEKEKSSGDEEKCGCIVRKEEAQALLTLLTSQTLPPGQPLWQFVLLESVELQPPGTAADILASEGGENTCIQRNRPGHCSIGTSSIEKAASEARSRIARSPVRLCVDERNREIRHSKHAKTSSGDSAAHPVQNRYTAVAAKDMVAERKRSSSPGVGRTVRSRTLSAVYSRATTNSLGGTCATLRNTPETGKVSFQERRPLGVQTKDGDSRGVHHAVSVKGGTEKWRKPIITARPNTPTETAESGEDAIRRAQASTDESRKKEVTNQEAASRSGRETAKRGVPSCGGDCMPGHSGGVREANKDSLRKSREPCIGSMIIFRVHHSVADGIALTNMFLSDVFTASPPKRQHPSPLVEQGSSSTALPAAPRDVMPAAVPRVTVSPAKKETGMQKQHVHHNGMKTRSEELGDVVGQPMQKQRVCGESVSTAGGQEQIAGLRTRTLQSELPSNTPSTTAASSPASGGHRLEAEMLCRCYSGPLAERGQRSRSGGPGAGATDSVAGPLPCAAIATVNSSVLSSACAQLRSAVGVSIPVAAAAASNGISAGSVHSPAISSGTDGSTSHLTSSCSVSGSLLVVDSASGGVGNTPTLETPLVFSAEADSLPCPRHNELSYSQAKVHSCHSKSPRCRRQTEKPTTVETVPQGRSCSTSAALADSMFSLNTENNAAPAQSPIKPMVPPVSPPSLLPRLLIQVVAYLRIPWEVCSLLALRRDRSWDSVVQPRRPRVGWAHEVHSIRFNLQQLRKLRQCLATASVGKIGRPVNPPAGSLCRQSASLGYTRILHELHRAVSVALKPLLCLVQQLFTSSPLQIKCTGESSLFPTCGDSTYPAGPSVSAAVAAAASAASTDAALVRPGKHDVTASDKWTIGTLDSASGTGPWTPAAGYVLLSLAKTFIAPIRLSVTALGTAARTVGRFHCTCLKRKRYRNDTSSDSISSIPSAATSSPTEAASEPGASGAAAATKSFTINELLTSCVAGGVTRYIRATTAADRVEGPPAKTQKQNVFHSSGHHEFVYQPLPVSLPSTPGQGGKNARPLQRRLTSVRRHDDTRKVQVSFSRRQVGDKSTTAADFFGGFPGAFSTDEAVSSAAQPRPAADSSSSCRWRRGSIGRWKHQRMKTASGREASGQGPTHKDIPAASTRHGIAHCARTTSPSRSATSDGENGKNLDTRMHSGKREAYGEEATWNDEGLNAQQGCITAATSISDNLCRPSVGQDIGSESNRASGTNAFSRSMYKDVAPHTAGKYSANTAGRAWMAVDALAHGDADRQAGHFLPRGSPHSLHFQGNCQILTGSKNTTPTLRWNVPDTQPHHHSEKTSNAQAPFGEAPLSAGVARLPEGTEVAQARAPTSKPLPLLTDANIRVKEQLRVVAGCTDKNRVGQSRQLAINAREHTCAGRPARRFTLQEWQVDRPAAQAAATETTETERENKKTASSEGLQQIRQSLLDLNIVVPVNLRTTEEESFQLHNKFTSSVVQLAVADLFFASNAYERLLKVQAQLRKSVKSAGASVFGLMEKICFATTPDFTWFLHMWLTNKLSMVFSNVPGPPVLPQIHGRQVYRMNFIGSLAGKVGINASAFSYANSIDLVLHIDRAVLASPELFRKCIVDEYRELEQLCAYRRSPSQIGSTRTKGSRTEVLEQND